MSASRILSFTEPYSYQAAIRATEGKIFVTARGDFRAELTQIDLPRLWMQRGRENLPRIHHATLTTERAPIGFLAGANQPAVHHCGLEVSPGDIIVNGSCSAFQRRTSGPCDWASMSLTPNDLSATATAITGHDLAVPSVTKVIRPPASAMSRLLDLHESTSRLAKVAPDMLTHPEVARALEQGLLYAMITCLTSGAPVERCSRIHHHSRVIARFEEFLAANYNRPLYLSEICTAIGASVRTLQGCCHDVLGMAPMRYLWLRRMHLAHRALLLADPTATTTVTEIATMFGFWELGRFSVAYRALFGETPSTTMRRPVQDQSAREDSPLALPVA